MGRKQDFTAEQVIEAIRGSGGIQATIAKRLGCHRHTVENYLARYATARQAYEDECQTTDDLAESVIIQNIKLALVEQQKLKRPVDSSDSKWWLERRRRDKFSTRQEVAAAAESDKMARELANLSDDELEAEIERLNVPGSNDNDAN